MTDGGWKYAAASVIGTSHQVTTNPACQDAHACFYLPTSHVLVTVVADGAGSAAHSQEGSQCTCDYVTERIRAAVPAALFNHEFAADVLHGLREQLQQRADHAGLRLRDFACTMLVAILGEHSGAFWQIGDGAMCFRLRDQEQFQYAFWPEKGDYANVTFFVTDATALDRLEIDVVECEIVEFAAFSDGVERLALNFATGEPHAAFFNGLFPHLRPAVPGYSSGISADITGFLGSERVNKRTDDDKTLILASRLL